MTQVPEVYVLGGYQTDFARNWSKEKKHFVAMMREAVLGAPRRVLLGDRSGIQRPSDLASRSRMRVRQHRPPGGFG
jgi:hypothetical protein